VSDPTRCDALLSRGSLYRVRSQGEVFDIPIVIPVLVHHVPDFSVEDLLSCQRVSAV